MKITMNEVMLSDKAMIKDVIETVDNPFDLASNQFLGIDSRKARRKKRQKPNLIVITYVCRIRLVKNVKLFWAMPIDLIFIMLAYGTGIRLLKNVRIFLWAIKQLKKTNHH
jgi:hypothetical protein